MDAATTIHDNNSVGTGTVATSGSTSHKPEVNHEVCVVLFLDSSFRLLGYARRSSTHAPRPHDAHLYAQSLSLKVDLEAQRVEGQATLWVVLPALATPPAAASSEDHSSPREHRPIDYRLHARQMAISAVRVNGEAVPFTYPSPSLDLLRSFVPGNGERGEERSGEAADLHYRCEFVAAQEGELGLQLPPGEGWKAERDAGEGEVVPKVILNMRNVRVRAPSAVGRLTS